MSEPQPEDQPVSLTDQFRSQGLTLAFLIPVVITIIWGASALNSDVEHLTERLEVVNRKMDRANNAISDTNRDVGRVKMDVVGVKVKLVAVDKDVDRLTRDVALTRSQGIVTGRGVEKIKQDLNIDDEETFNRTGR